MEKFLPLFRDIENHWIYSNSDYLKIWITILLRTRYAYEPNKQTYHGMAYEQKRGEFIFGRKYWSSILGIPEGVIRGCFKKLIKDDMIVLVKNVSNQYSIFSVRNYEKYNQGSNQGSNQSETLRLEQFQGTSNQGSNQGSNRGLTKDQPRLNQGLTTEEDSKERKKEKKDKNVVTITEVNAKKPFGEFGNVLLTEQQYLEYCGKYGKIVIDKYINDVDIWFGNNPDICKKRKEHLLTLVQFLKKGNEKEIIAVKKADVIVPEPGSSIFDIDSFIKERGIDSLDEIGKPKRENW